VVGEEIECVREERREPRCARNGRDASTCQSSLPYLTHLGSLLLSCVLTLDYEGTCGVQSKELDREATTLYPLSSRDFRFWHILALSSLSFSPPCILTPNVPSCTVRHVCLQ
jgi:hypothetical protein